MSSLVVRAIQITNRARETAKNALRFGVHQSFAIARSHYENIDLATMSEGFTLGYFEVELEEIKEWVAP